MKKKIFTALVATVAVGGALSANADDIYPELVATVYICNTAANPTCLENLPPGKLYKDPERTIEWTREELVDYHYVGIK